MEARRNPYHFDPEIYLQGNTARKLNRIENTDETVNESDEYDRYAKSTRYGSAAPKRVPEHSAPAKKERPARKAEPQRQNRFAEEWNSERSIVPIHRGLNFFGMITIGLAVAAIVYVCVTFLQIQSESTRLDGKIASLQTELAMVIDANHAKEEEITSSVDMEKVYQMAVGKYGMVFPNQNEVVYYSAANTGYVRQYAKIPEAVNAVLDKLLP